MKKLIAILLSILGLGIIRDAIGWESWRNPQNVDELEVGYEKVFAEQGYEVRCGIKSPYMRIVVVKDYLGDDGWIYPLVVCALNGSYSLMKTCEDIEYLHVWVDNYQIKFSRGSVNKIIRPARKHIYYEEDKSYSQILYNSILNSSTILQYSIKEETTKLNRSQYEDFYSSMTKATTADWENADWGISH